MILVDTNVMSEVMRPHPEPRVVAWLDAQNAESLFLTTISLAELLYGIAILPSGRRKTMLGSKLRDGVLPYFQDRILSFDLDAAEAFATAVARARAAGRSVSLADGQIAAIAACRGFAVATRDAKPFRAIGVPVVNPWDARPR